MTALTPACSYVPLLCTTLFLTQPGLIEDPLPKHEDHTLELYINHMGLAV